MRSAVRWIAVVVFAFAMAPLLRADDDASPKAAATNKAAVASVAAGADAKPEPNAVEPGRSSARRPSSSAAQTQAARTRHRRQEDGTPKVEWFLGYSFWRAMPTSPNNRMGYLHGGSTSIAYNFNRWFGLAADFGGYDNNHVTLFGPSGSLTYNTGGSAYTYAAGPRFSYRGIEHFTPFIQALFGGTSATSVSINGCTGNAGCTPLGSENVFAAMFGLGFDIKLSRHFALRPFEGDFLLTHYRNILSASGQSGWQQNVRFSSGIVFRFGGNSAPEPPVAMTAVCSADKETVFEGSGDVVAVRAEASNGGSNPVNYSWSASQGTIDGTGPEIRWSSSDRGPGTYTVRAHVDNGRNGSAECSSNIIVAVRPNRPPTMSCSTDRRAATAGEPIQVTASASDPDNDPLTYSWNASGGTVQGSGSSVTLQTTELPAGPYTVTGHVDDGRNGTADCMVNVDVRAVQVVVPAEQTALETRLALHSIYFATARPTVENADGGLVDSQQAVLVLLASDFVRYLSFKPQAHLTLEGHADRRGSAEYNNDLTERRVARTKSFLIAHGVPAANIETQSLGKQENLDADQVKQLVEQNPDLNNDERQKIEGNLQTIVWANNRRVDISINTTGQQSTRQYPFNAKDSLTLLSAEGSHGGTKTAKKTIEKKVTGK